VDSRAEAELSTHPGASSKWQKSIIQVTPQVGSSLWKPTGPSSGAFHDGHDPYENGFPREVSDANYEKHKQAMKALGLIK
jgi:hypothetical protein